MKYVGLLVVLCHYGPALLRFCFQTDLERKISASFIKIQAGKTLSYHGEFSFEQSQFYSKVVTKLHDSIIGLSRKNVSVLILNRYILEGLSQSCQSSDDFFVHFQF